MTYDVPFIRPVFPPATVIAGDWDEIVASNWFTNFGPRERRLAAAVADRIGSGYHAVTFANATIALIGLIGEALGRGDGTRSVAVPSFTFAAGAEAIEWAGYRPVFLDIEAGSLQPSLPEARKLRADLGDELAGVLLCNTFGIGNPAIADWGAWATESGIPLLIDSAAGFGSDYVDGRPVGVAGAAEVFSFHATKPFAIGEGGAVVTRDEDLAQRLRAFQNFGFGPDRAAVGLGLNGKLPELSAAIGLRQLESFDAAVATRRSVVESYRGALEPAGWRFPENIGRSSVCFATVVAPDGETRDAALAALASSRVEARAYYAPVVHRQPRYAVPALDLPVTDDVASRVVSLPVHQDMAEADVARVIGALDAVRSR